MKVAVFLGDYSPSIGGGYTFQQEICQAIESYGPGSGHDFVFFTPSRVDSKAAAVGAYKLIQIEAAAAESRLLNLSRRCLRFFAAALNRRYPAPFLQRVADPISAHMRSEAIDVAWALTPSCYSTEVPFLVTLWDLEHRNQPHFPEVSRENEWEAREEVYSTLLKKAAYVLTGTRAGMAEIMKFYHLPGARIRVLPFPAPRFPGQQSLPAEKRLLQDYGLPDRYLFYPAQFWPHKNHYGVLMTLVALRERYGLTLPVVFVGSDKGNLGYIKKLVEELGLTGQVHFLGFVPRDHLPALYRHALALLFLSFFGPDNLPPLEAFALGCPVIASNVSGAQEQLGDAALLVDQTDPSDVAAAINRVVKDEALRRELASRGVERAAALTGEGYFRGVCAILDEFTSVRRTWSSSDPFRLVR